MKYHFILLLFLSITLNSLAQEISIVVYKGTVSFGKEPLLFKTRYEIPPKSNTTITYGTNSKFTIFSSTKLYQHTIKESASISYSQILNNLNINAPTSFLKLMSSYHDFTKIQSETKGSAVGAAKGLNDRKDVELNAREDVFLPLDSAKTGSKSIDLNWKIKNSIMGGRLYVIHQQTKDTIYNQPATNVGKINITIEKTGNYDWFIYSKIDKKRRINQSFIKLSEEESNKMKSDFEAFKKAIAVFDEELQDTLIEEYKLTFGIID